METWQNRIVGYSEEAPDQLLANPANWRTHPDSQASALRGVLREVGVVQNVLANKRTGFLIDGHLRVMEALKAGQPTIPVTWVDLAPEEEALILATLDPLSALAGTDAAQLDALLREVSTGEADVQRMLDELAQEAGIVPGVEAGGGGDEFDATPQDGPTRTATGDLWVIGGVHRLVVGDCADPATVARLMGGELADGIITDPPYSSGGFTRGDRTLSTAKKYVQGGTQVERPDFAGDNRDQRSWIGWMERWLSLYLQQVKAGAVIASWTDWRQLPATTDAVQGGGWVWRGVAVWDKTESARPLYGRFRPQAEYLVWGSAGNLPLNDGRPCYPGVFTKAVDSGKEHITQKPIEVGEWSMSMVEERGLIVDPFFGSGTSIIAAHRTGRRCYGCEISEKYADVVLRRAEAEGMTCEKLSEL